MHSKNESAERHDPVWICCGGKLLVSGSGEEYDKLLIPRNCKSQFGKWNKVMRIGLFKKIALVLITALFCSLGMLGQKLGGGNGPETKPPNPRPSQNQGPVFPLPPPAPPQPPCCIVFSTKPKDSETDTEKKRQLNRLGEQYRGAMEDYNHGLEDFRLQIENGRTKGQIDATQYGSYMNRYREGIMNYKNGIQQYRRGWLENGTGTVEPGVDLDKNITDFGHKLNDYHNQFNSGANQKHDSGFGGITK